MPKYFFTCFLPILIGLILPAGDLQADELSIEIVGVQEPALTNVRIQVEPFHIAGTNRLSRRRRGQIVLSAEQNARTALRPFGYYQPSIHSRMTEKAEGSWVMELNINPGPPVLIAEVSLNIEGAGASLPELQEWRTDWPLLKGGILLQTDWDSQKERALDIAADNGYLLAHYPEHRMAVDLIKNQAQLTLTLDTGPQAVMGEVRFKQDIVTPHILENLPRFKSGDPYNAWIMERFRIDLWRTGYFTNINVVEDRQLQESPPRVNLDVTLDARKPNTYQGAIGFGSDTGPRVQFSWNRHLISEYGDNISLATGWHDHNNEFFIRGGYRFPRNVESRQFWIADALLKRENEDLKVSDNSDDETLYTLGNANINDYSIRLGRLRVRDRKSGFRQGFETIYGQFLREYIDYNVKPNDPLEVQEILSEDSVEVPLGRTSDSLIFGVEYSMPYIRGQGFQTTGLHNRGWAFTSNKAWGSERNYSQVYLSSRRNFLVGDRLKFLLRGEVAYSDAEVSTIDVDIEGTPVSMSVTNLPNLFRFKAGGSSSVRGYAFESLSNNNIGSNNIVTASAEAELMVLRNWSAAVFVDVGNAFNDWGDTNLKRGIGVGIRWYTIAGAIRVDFAKALDLPDQPWRLHFTIGTPLL